jgi:hypothetical protein
VKLQSNNCYIYSNRKNLADPFTKGLSRNVIDCVSREMGLRTIDVMPYQ